MSNYGFAGHGFSLKALLENPDLQTAPSVNRGNFDVKKPGLKNGNIPMPNTNSAFLGSNLWEKQSGEDGFDLEYMDLDEFLSENGIPVNLEENDEAETISLLASALARTPPRSPNTNHDLSIGPPSPNLEPSPRLPSKDNSNDASSLGVYIPDSPGCQQNISPITLSPPVVQEPSAIEKCLMDDNFGVKTVNKTPMVIQCTTPAKLTTGSKRPHSYDDDINDDSGDMGLVTIPVYHQKSPTNRVSDYNPQAFDEWNVSEASNDSQYYGENDSLVTQVALPGQDNFDPTSRKFSSEELKPQPIIKKSKKTFVEEANKDERYWQRRKKNNVAAKRSRDARRVKENQIAMRAAFLESENDDLKLEMEKVRKENKELIKRLSKYEEV
ncbi:hypothetical protein ACF0H5_010434 [Mactra antiquata]